MTTAIARLHRIRDKLVAIRMDLRARVRSTPDTEPDVDGHRDARAPTGRPDIDLERVPDLLERGDRDDVNRAVGWLLTVPDVPEDLAEKIVDRCLIRATDESFSVSRLAYRGIGAIADHHPTLVEPHAPEIARGLTARYVVVQEACASLLVDLCVRNPALTPVVYPYLRSDEQRARPIAFGVVLDIAQEHPVVLCALDPYLRDQLAAPAISRQKLAQAALLRARRDQDALATAVPFMLDWLPTTDRELEDAVVHAVTSWDGIPDDGASRFLRTCLNYLASGARPHRNVASTWIVRAVRTDPELGRAIEDWEADTNEWDRLRVAAAIDETTDRGIEVVGPHLLRAGDTFASEFGDVVDPGTG